MDISIFKDGRVQFTNTGVKLCLGVTCFSPCPSIYLSIHPSITFWFLRGLWDGRLVFNKYCILTFIVCSVRLSHLLLLFFQLDDFENEIGFQDQKLPDTCIPTLENFRITSPIKLCVVKLYGKKVSQES